MSRFPESAEIDPASGLSYGLTSACHGMAKGQGWKDFVSAKCDGKTFGIIDYKDTSERNADAAIQITRAELAAWAVEYGLARLRHELRVAL